MGCRHSEGRFLARGICTLLSPRALQADPSLSLGMTTSGFRRLDMLFVFLYTYAKNDSRFLCASVVVACRSIFGVLRRGLAVLFLSALCHCGLAGG
jgi:hypothetical protein